MKRILLFTDSLGAGGAQRQLVGLAVLLKQKGYDVQVAVYHDNPFYAGYLKDNNVPYQLIPNATSSVKRIPAITRYFKKQNPDWVIAYQESPSTFACLAKVLGGRFKLMVSERSTTQSVTWREKVRFFLYRWADWIVPNCFAQERFLKEYSPKLSEKIKTITNFVDLEKFHPVKHERRDVPVVMIAATIVKHKNVLNFIKAVSLLKDRCIRFCVKWYGVLETISELNKSYYEQCLRLINGLKLSDEIELLPKSKDIAEKYQLADYFCLPSFYEGTPNVICEALASGLPVICSDVCDNGIYVKEGENGFLFNPKDIESMANALENVLGLSDENYDSYCRHSREMAEELLSEEKFIQKYIELIEQRYTREQLEEIFAKYSK